ncbi:MAG: metallophosphoesterase family protein [Lachnospiraceae bacterium]|nr:metallophosphoesterase family protein [Lachnospiraceae bacterium]
MRIAVISDTHNLLREEVKEYIMDCDVILHAGDICRPDVYGQIAALGKPFYAVRGNNDGKWAVEKGILDCLDIELEGWRIFMVHDRRDIPKDMLEKGIGQGIVVFGHSHKYETFSVGETLFLNPGSCGPVRFRLPVTMAIVEIGAGDAHVTPITFAEQNFRCEISPGEMKTLVTAVVKDIKKNKSAAQIAKKHRISLELSEQICRLYLTHPGVTVDGILGKMGM